MNKLRNKRDFLAAQAAGLTGNHLQTWATVTEYQASDFRRQVGLRSRIVGSRLNRFYIWPHEMDDALAEAVSLDISIDSLYVNESPPQPEHVIIQGEVTRNEHGLYIFYSTAGEVMRVALKTAVAVTGLKAKAILEYHMPAADLDDLYDIMDSYPESVIEFTIYDSKVGKIPNRRCLIWEVRNY